MSRLARRAEVIKLARLLRVDESTLSGLSDLDATSLRTFREQAQARLFDADEARLKRVAMASKLLPVPLIALIGEHVFGALLCARVAGLIAPDRAAEVTLRLETEFLADVTLEIDPRHVREVIARIPVPRLVEVALVLARRREFVTLARFVDYVSTDAIRAVMEQLTDNAALLQIAFFMEDKSRLNELVGLLPKARLREIIIVAAAESRDLWAEALALMSEVNDRWRKHLGELAAGLDDRVLLSMARAAQAQKLWGALLPIIGLLERAHQQRLLQLPVLREVPMLEAVLDAADSEGLWDRLLPLLPLLDEPAQQALAQAAERLGDDAFGRVFEAVQAGREWGPLLVLLLRLRSQTQDRLRPLIAKLSPQAARQLLLEADQLGVMDRVDALWRRLTLGRPA